MTVAVLLLAGTTAAAAWFRSATERSAALADADLSETAKLITELRRYAVAENTADPSIAGRPTTEPHQDEGASDEAMTRRRVQPIHSRAF